MTLVELEVDTVGAVDPDLLKKGAEVSLYCQKDTVFCQCNRAGWGEEECKTMLEGDRKECAFCRGERPSKGGLNQWMREFVGGQSASQRPAVVAECREWSVSRRHIDEAQSGDRPVVLKKGNVLLFQVPVEHRCAISLNFAGLKDPGAETSFGGHPSQGLIVPPTRISSAHLDAKDLTGLRCKFSIFNRQKKNPYFGQTSPSGVDCEATRDIATRLAQYEKGKRLVGPAPQKPNPQKRKAGAMEAFFLGVMTPLYLFKN